MGEILPDGRIQGYTCAVCGGECNMLATGHGPGKCVPEIDVTECPDCAEKGRYDGRTLHGGRGVYRCPNGHRWQDANEKPTNKGTPIPSSGGATDESERDVVTNE